jgi:hypothetical protein
MGWIKQGGEGAALISERVREVLGPLLTVFVSHTAYLQTLC